MKVERRLTPVLYICGVTPPLVLELQNSNTSSSFIARCVMGLQLLKHHPLDHVNHTPGLTHPCSKVLTPQCHRCTRAVGFYLSTIREPSLVYLQALVCVTGQVQKRTLRAIGTLIFQCSPVILDMEFHAHP